MSDDYEAAITAAQAGLDQYVAMCRPILRSVAAFGKAAREEGCSEVVSDALTLRVANMFLTGMFGAGVPS